MGRIRKMLSVFQVFSRLGFSRLGRRGTLAATAAALGALLWAGVGVYQSQPAQPAISFDPKAPAGNAMLTTTAALMETQLDGQGGWLPNDSLLSPGRFLDNLPHHQRGVLQVIRHTTRVLRDHLTRQRTSDAVLPEADQAYTAFANDPESWVFPEVESRYRTGAASLKTLRAHLNDTTHFDPRADNLVQLLEAYSSELGAVNSRLLQSKDPNLVSWFAIDNNFYYAQGVAQALLWEMKAVKSDFRDVLADKHAVEITGMIITSLEESQFNPWLVTNGDKAGLLANHSNNLKAYLDDARQKINSLISMLKQG
ncbi:MAG: DUF2333 family protein [Deltaproteobacteria bacterium]|nr:DUF2333 family protein [Deltaproteobacteria bacterium]